MVRCSICRRTSGATFVSWFTVSRDAFRFVAGEPAMFRSSTYALRTFCPRCGTPLTFASDRTPDEVDVTTGSLDDPAQVAPRAHIHTGSKLAWVELSDGLPQFVGEEATAERDS